MSFGDRRRDGGGGFDHHLGDSQLKISINLNLDRGKRIVVDLGRLPHDPGRRADIDHALRVLNDNEMIEWMKLERDVGSGK